MVTRIMLAALLGWLWVGWGWVRTAYADDTRPIQQLPTDLLRWSTVWAHVPQEMVAVGQEEGPLSGMMWGSAKGIAAMVRATTDEVERTVTPERRARRGRGSTYPPGVLLRYEF